MRRGLPAALGAVVPAATAAACPLCHTDTGEQVRSGIFGPDFWFNVLVTLLPFIVFVAITACIYFGVPTGFRRSQGANLGEKPEPRQRAQAGEAYR